jgi:hypothetical protein
MLEGMIVVGKATGKAGYARAVLASLEELIKNL